MKYFRLIIIFFVFLLSACGNKRELTRKEWLTLQDGWYEDFDLYHSSSIDLVDQWSPNGKWVVNEVFLKSDYPLVQWISFSNPSQTIVDISTMYYGKYFALGSWSPNSETVFYGATDEGGAGCPYHRLVFYALDKNGEWLSSHTFEFEDDYFCPRFGKWAFDSSKIAIQLSKGIYLIDHEANLLTIISPDLSETQFIQSLDWISSNHVLYRIIDGEVDDFETGIEYRILNVSGGKDEDFRYFPNKWTVFISADSQGQHLMFITSEYDAKDFSLDIVNSENAEIVKVIQIEGDFQNSVTSPDKRYVAIGYDAYPESEDENLGNTLWVYDWENGEIFIEENIKYLINWNTELQGFVIERYSTGNETILDVIIP